jgi:hypothetical protein
MKGTLFSADFVKDSSGNLRLLELNTDTGFINKWIMNSFLAKDTKAFRAYVKEISPDLDLKFNFVSELTGETEALDIPFGIGFFYPTT